MPPNPRPHDQPLMRHYYRRLGLRHKEVVAGAGIADSQLSYAMNRTVGRSVAERLASFVAEQLGLSLIECLMLKAELIGKPGWVELAYFGNITEAGRVLGVSRATAAKLLEPDAPLLPHQKERIISRAKAADVPPEIVKRLESRPEAEPGSRVTWSTFGLEGRNKRAAGLFMFRMFKPNAAAALDASGLARKEIAERAGVGKETMRKALYERVGRKAAASISAVLADAAGLSEEDRRAIQEELKTAPQKNF